MSEEVPDKKVKVLDREHVGITAKLTVTQALQLVSANPSDWYGSGTQRRISAIELRLPEAVQAPGEEDVSILDSGFGLNRYPLPEMTTSGNYKLFGRPGAGLGSFDRWGQSLAA